MRDTSEEIMAEWQELEKERLQVRVNILSYTRCKKFLDVEQNLYVVWLSY